MSVERHVPPRVQGSVSRRYTRSDQVLGAIITSMAVIVAAVIGALASESFRCEVLGIRCGSGAPPPPPTATLSPSQIGITIYSSDTKEDWLNAVIERFNAAEIALGTGKTVVVRAEHVKSGSSMQAILDGKIQPTVWSPGEQSWVENINQVWRDRTGAPLIPEPCHATVYAPVGFAMWRPMAEAMGWPDGPIGWDEIVALAADPAGWATYGHPEWGQFKFGHTHPDYSNSGLLLLTALAYSALDRTEGLTADLVHDDAVIDAMRTVELHTYHYGVASRDNTMRMVQLGPDYLHATNTTEAETLRTNSRVYGEPHFPLVFIFPAEGTFWAEQPYCVLDADWVTDEQRAAALRFGAYLVQREQQVLAVEYYLRPVDPTIALHAPLTLENGTDPTMSPARVPALGSPSPEVTGAIQDVFHRTKKKATVVLVLDTSGSMEGDKIRSAVEATGSFIGHLERDDRVYAYAFNDRVTELSPPGRAGDVKEELAETVSHLYADGGTALYDAICLAVNRVAQLKADDEAAEEARLYGVVVLSDGQDTASQATQNEMFACLPEGEAAAGVKVFTIAYGRDADRDLLLRIANRTHAKTFSGDPEQIAGVYTAIAAEQ